MDYPDYWERRRLVRQTTLDCPAKLLLSVLLDYIGENETGWPSLATLAADISRSERQTRRIMSELTDSGLIASNRRGSTLTNEYRILWERMKDCQRAEGDGTPMSAHRESERTQMTGVTGHPRPSERTPTSEVSGHPRQPNIQRTSSNSHEKKQQCQVRFDASHVDLPEVLDTDEFRMSWKEWCEWRRTEKRKPITKTSAAKQINLLAKRPDLAVETIERSITNGWIGLFPESQGQQQSRMSAGERRIQATKIALDAVFGPDEEDAA